MGCTKSSNDEVYGVRHNSLHQKTLKNPPLNSPTELFMNEAL